MLVSMRRTKMARTSNRYNSGYTANTVAKNSSAVLCATRGMDVGNEPFSEVGLYRQEANICSEVVPSSEVVLYR